MCNQGKYPKLVEKCIRIIETEFMYIAGIEDVADNLGVTKHHLIREFTKYMYISPNKYLIKFKLEQSKVLLAEDQLSIDDIARAIGFSSGNYFAKVFRKEYQMTPTEFIKSSPIVTKPFMDQQIYL